MTFDSKKSVEARRMGSSLIAAFHRANPPMIWRFDLERNHSFTLALQGEEGEWELGLTSARGEFLPVTRFVDREDAEEAFVKVERALASSRFPVLRGLLKTLFLVAVLSAALLFVGFMGNKGLPWMMAQLDHISGKSSVEGSVDTASFPPPSFGSPPASPPPDLSKMRGMPVPADEFLQPPSP